MPYRCCQNVDEAVDYFKDTALGREELPFWIDGVVMKGAANFAFMSEAVSKSGSAHDAAEKAQQMKEAIEAAKATVDKLKAVQSKVVDAIRATETQKDKTGEAKELVAEENKELKAEMGAAALKAALAQFVESGQAGLGDGRHIRQQR